MLFENLVYEYKPYWTLLIADRANAELNSPLAHWSAIILFCVSIVLVWERYKHRILEKRSLRTHGKIQAEIKRYGRKKRRARFG